MRAKTPRKSPKASAEPRSVVKPIEPAYASSQTPKEASLLRDSASTAPAAKVHTRVSWLTNSRMAIAVVLLPGVAWIVGALLNPNDAFTNLQDIYDFGVFLMVYLPVSAIVSSPIVAIAVPVLFAASLIGLFKALRGTLFVLFIASFSYAVYLFYVAYTVSDDEFA